MVNEADLPLGTVGCVDTKSFFGRIIKWATKSPVSHAVVYVGNGQLVEAEPEGARIRPWDEYGDAMVWLTDMYRMDEDGVLVGTLDPTPEQREAIAARARVCASFAIGYSWLDIAILALASPRLDRIDPDHAPWWARRLQSTDTMVCSQLCDYVWQKAGLHIYAGRVPGLVSPGDLYRAGGSPAVP